MASFRCYNNSDVIATLITTNFHLYLIQKWWQLFQMFVYGDVVYAQTWQVLTLKNCMEPFSYASTAYLVASALVSVRLFCKNLGNLQKFFGQMVYRPPWQKIARTPMHLLLFWGVGGRVVGGGRLLPRDFVLFSHFWLFASTRTTRLC